MGHIRGTSRTARRGLDGLKARALAKFNFHAPLKTSVALVRGIGAASYTGATVKTVKDFEGGIRNTLSGEVRFEGQRRVYNYLAASARKSEDLTDAGWTKTSVTAVDADTANFTAASGELFAPCSLSHAAASRTWLVRAKMRAGTASQIYLGLTDNVAWTAGRAAQSSAISLTAEWRVYSFLATFDATAVGTAIVPVLGMQGHLGNPNLTTGTVDITEIQVEQVTNQSNQNPSEYVSVGAAKLNELTYTEEFDNAAWTKTRASISANATQGPRGAQTADKLIEDATAAQTHLLAQSFTPVAGATYTLYFDVKAAERTWVAVQGDANFSSATAYFDVANGAIGTVANSPSATITDIGGGYYRCAITKVAIAAVSSAFRLYLATADNVSTYNGDNASGVYVGSAQASRAGAPSPYSPVGNVYPFHGACVDGVKYFDYENGNTVSGNIVTEAVGRSLDGYSVGYCGGLLIGPSGATSAFIATHSGAQLTGDITIDWELVVETLTPSAPGYLGPSRRQVATEGEYAVTITAAGAPNLTWWDTGGSARGGSFNNALSTYPITAGERIRFRFTRVMDNGSGRCIMAVYYSRDGGATFTLGESKDVGSTAAVGTVKETSQPTAIGHSASGYGYPQEFFYFAAYSGAGESRTLVVKCDPREGWTENLIANSTDLNTWTKNNSATASGNTMTAVTTFSYIQSNTVSQPAAIYALRVRASASVDTPCALRVTDGADGNPVSSLVVNLTTTPQDFELIGDLSSGFSGTLAILIGGLSPTACTLGAVITLHGVSARRLSVASQRTSSQILPTTGSTLRGWIDSLGAQWTISGVATVFQRQNIPRFLSDTGTSNLLLQSQDLTTTWAVSGADTSISANSTTVLAPDGTATADKLQEATTAVTTHDLTQTVAKAGSSLPYAFSFFVKPGERTALLVELGSSGNGVYCRWSVSGEPSLITGQVAFGAGWTVGSTGCIRIGNGWYWIWMTATSDTGANIIPRVRLYNGADSYAGVVNSGLYLWGMQLEQASMPSSYIPTVAASVPRSADVLTYPAAGNAVSTACSIYAEASVNMVVGNPRIAVICQASSPTNERLLDAYWVSSAALGAYASNGGVAQYNDSSSVGSVMTGPFKNKLAATITTNRAVKAVNGVLGTEDGAVTTNTLFDTIQVAQFTGANEPCGTVGEIRIAQRVLTNGELVAISR